MAATIGFRVRIGDLEISGGDRRPPAQLLRLRTELTMDGVGGRAQLALSASGALEASIGESVEIDLDAGDGSSPVFRGQVRALTGDASTLWLDAADSLSALALREYVGTFAESDAKTIARAILDDGEVPVGTLATGPTFARYVLAPGPSALAQLRTLARRCGLDLFTDRTGAVCMTATTYTGAILTIADDTPILQIRVERRTPPADGVTLYGEGAASSRGASRSHWLVRDLSPTRGQAKLTTAGEVKRSASARPRTFVDGAVRSGEFAASLAEAKTQALASSQLCGTLTLLGQPHLTPGDLIHIGNLGRRLPAVAAAVGDAELRVRTVVHHLDAGRGLFTEVEL